MLLSAGWGFIVTPIILAGVLSTVLTKKFDIEKTPYFKIRQIFLMFSGFFLSIPAVLLWISQNTSASIHVMILAPFVLFAIELCFLIAIRIRKKTKGLLKAVLSDFIAYEVIMLTFEFIYISIQLKN